MTLNERIEANKKDITIRRDMYYESVTIRLDLMRETYESGNSVEDIIAIFRTTRGYLLKEFPEWFEDESDALTEGPAPALVFGL